MLKIKFISNAVEKIGTDTHLVDVHDTSDEESDAAADDVQDQMYLDHDDFLEAAARMLDNNAAFVENSAAENTEADARKRDGVNEEPNDTMAVEKEAVSDSLGDSAEISEVPTHIMPLADSRVSL